MDILSLQDRRDFPLTTNSLAFMQAAYAALEKLGYIGGDNYIVSGCTVTGSSAAPGYMFLKGILMPFLGGTIQTNVKIVKVVTSIDVDAGVREQTSYRAEFGTSVNNDDNVAWTDIVRTDTIISLMSQMTELNNRLTDIEDDILVNAQDIQANADEIEALKLSVIDWTDGNIEGGNHGANSFIRCAKVGNIVYIHGDIQCPSQPDEDDVLFSLPAEFPDFTEAMHFAATGGEPTETYELKLAVGSTNIVSGAGQASDSTASFSLAIPII